MFKFLKDKLKGAISTFSKNVDKKAEEETKEEEIVEKEIEAKEEKASEDLKRIEEEAEKEKQDLKRIEEERKEEEKRKQEQKKKEEELKLEEEKELKRLERKKKEEEFRKAEEERERKEQEERQKKAEEEDRLEEERKRKEEDLRKLEEERKQKEEELKEVQEKKGLFAKLKKKFVKEKPAEQTVKEEPEKKPVEPEKKAESFIGKVKQTIVTKKINEHQFEGLFWDLELALLENNVAVEVIEKIKNDMKEYIVDKPIARSKIEKVIEESLKNSIQDLFKLKGFDLLDKAREKKPYVICFVGINGSGKTTSIAKVAHLFKSNSLSCVLAASDTFRAASIEQLQKHSDNLGIKLIKHDYGADPAAVAYDAVKHAEAKKIDVVLIDTAGRMHANINLIDEMKKIVRVAKPDLKIFVGESITGNDCVEQAKRFDEAIGIDGIILSKADIDEKGGAAVSVSYVTGKPILYLGVGQNYEDLQKFDAETTMKSLGLAD